MLAGQAAPGSEAAETAEGATARSAAGAPPAAAGGQDGLPDALGLLAAVQTERDAAQAQVAGLQAELKAAHDKVCGVWG